MDDKHNRLTFYFPKEGNNEEVDELYHLLKKLKYKKLDFVLWMFKNFKTSYGIEDISSLSREDVESLIKLSISTINHSPINNTSTHIEHITNDNNKPVSKKTQTKSKPKPKEKENNIENSNFNMSMDSMNQFMKGLNVFS